MALVWDSLLGDCRAHCIRSLAMTIGIFYLPLLADSDFPATARTSPFMPKATYGDEALWGSTYTSVAHI